MEKYMELIFDYQKRKKMQSHPVFMDIYQEYKLEEEKYGNTKYLLRQAHENLSGNGVVKLDDWIMYYFNSGQKRKSIGNTIQANKYCGRTEEELLSLSRQLLDDINNKKKHKITLQAAANIVFIKIIDEAYENYMRSCNVMFRLAQANTGIQFSLTSPLDAETYDVDIMAKGVSGITGISVVPIDFTDISVYQQKHDIFKMIWGHDVLFIYADINGKTRHPIPVF